MIYFGGALMNQYVWETAEEMDAALAKRIRGIRKRRRLTQQDLSERSGVSLGTLKRFETTGQISLLSLTKLAIALGCALVAVDGVAHLGPQDGTVVKAGIFAITNHLDEVRRTEVGTQVVTARAVRVSAHL